MMGFIYSASAQTGEVKSTSGNKSTTGTVKNVESNGTYKTNSPSVNNSNRQRQGSGYIDVSKSPGTQLPTRKATKQ